MTCLVTIKKSGSVFNIVKVEALRVAPTSVEHSEGSGDYLYTITDESELNKLLNDYGHVVAYVNASEVLSLTFTGASEDTHIRKIADADWMKRTRPALMRAATATYLFNA